MRLPVLIALATAATTAELPVTAVTVIPGGLIVERAGTLPAGDEAVTGLPAELDPGSLVVELDGREVDAWRWALPEPPATVPADPAQAARMRAARQAEALAAVRASLGGEPARHHGEADKDVERTPAPLPALPQASAIAAQVAFAASNAGRAAEEAQAAAEAAERAGAAAPAQAARPAPALRIAGGGGRRVALRYLLPGASWAPAWRLEVEGSDAILVQLATIDLAIRSPLPTAPLALATRGRADAALLADPSVPILGLAESVELERKTPAATGSKGSESAVDCGARSMLRALRDGSGSVATDAQLALVVLGAGYDHKTPNKYRLAMKAAIRRLGDLDPSALDLPELALATSALAEAYAMTNDPELRPRCDAMIAALRRRWPQELPPMLSRPGPLAGPALAGQIVLALKAAHAGGLPVGDDLRSLRDVRLGEGEDAEIAGLLVAVCTGTHAPLIDLATAQRWVGSFDRWWNAGRSDLIEMAILVAFQNGGPEWQLVNRSLRDRLVGLQEADGLWPIAHHPLGRLYGSCECARALEVYYRYAPLAGGAGADRTGDGGADLFAARIAVPSEPAWPVRLAATVPVALVPGRQVVELRRARLAGAIRWEAVPAQSPGVWRRLAAANPWPAPLLAGPVTVVADGRCRGEAALAATAPGADLALDLGPDDRLRVRRTVLPASDDGVFKRTLTMTVSCRLEAPAGFAGTVQVSEALPRPQGDLIAVELRRPTELDDAAYRKRIATDPVLRASLSAASPEAVLAELRLTYARSVRPRLEAR